MYKYKHMNDQIRNYTTLENWINHNIGNMTVFNTYLYEDNAETFFIDINTQTLTRFHEYYSDQHQLQTVYQYYIKHQSDDEMTFVRPLRKGYVEKITVKVETDHNGISNLVGFIMHNTHKYDFDRVKEDTEWFSDDF